MSEMKRKINELSEIDNSDRIQEAAGLFREL